MKKYVVRLTDEERKICDSTVDRLKGSSQKARRARILLQVDADGPGWTDRQVADAFRCRVKTVENVRRRCVLEGFELALCGRQRSSPPRCRSCSTASRRRGSSRGVSARRRTATGAGRCGCWRGAWWNSASSPRSAMRGSGRH